MASVTLCVRHIPCKILETDFKKIMSEVGLDVSRYDVSFPGQEERPGKAQRGGNFGFGFVMCYHQADADAFISVFQGFQFKDVNSQKRLLVELSTSRRTTRASGNATVGPHVNKWFDSRHSSYNTSYQGGGYGLDVSQHLVANSGSSAMQSVGSGHDTLWHEPDHYSSYECTPPDVSQVPPTSLSHLSA
eukprot:TRINITY_DN25885_c0_g1_i2.p1 TRINITY_DN25885_c0_g1~~TRINITY_DN25885_c0_g1_i2.p1  ORF type:complete len:189 (-),score=15.39 TRINITY_DN25885_c0_g1_i2:108-674(-)